MFGYQKAPEIDLEAGGTSTPLYPGMTEDAPRSQTSHRPLLPNPDAGLLSLRPLPPSSAAASPASVSCSSPWPRSSQQGLTTARSKPGRENHAPVPGEEVGQFHGRGAPFPPPRSCRGAPSPSLPSLDADPRPTAAATLPMNTHGDRAQVRSRCSLNPLILKN
ncbi:hypothetical protein ZWY2020_040654 [Hordeum vulgare]|nr:hypothetical protein ZWY2020_040654 [Hordeum vulgare]